MLCCPCAPRPFLNNATLFFYKYTPSQMLWLDQGWTRVVVGIPNPLARVSPFFCLVGWVRLALLMFGFKDETWLRIAIVKFGLGNVLQAVLMVALKSPE